MQRTEQRNSRTSRNHRARAIKSAIPLVVGALLLLGTWRGDDDNFPFGPFRMYSTKQELDGQVRSLQLWGQDRRGRWQMLDIDDFGLRRADIEGQIGKLEEGPTVVLSELAASYERIHGEEMPWAALQLRDRIFTLVGGRPAAERVRVVGTWTVP